MSLYEVNRDIIIGNEVKSFNAGDICSINFAKINDNKGKIYIFNNTSQRGGKDGIPVDSKYFTQHKDDSDNDAEPYFDIIPRQKTSEVNIKTEARSGGRRTKRRTKKRSRKSRRL